MRALGLLTIGFLSALGCSTTTTTPATGLMVIITTDMTASEFDSIRLQVSQEVGVAPVTWNKLEDYAPTVPSELQLPGTVFVRSGHSPNQQALIVVTAYLAGQPVVLREVEVQVPTDRIAELRLVLSERCKGQVIAVGAEGDPAPTCPLAGQSCQPDTGTCASSLIAPDAGLPTYVAGDVDAAAGAMDASVAVADGGVTEGPLYGGGQIADSAGRSDAIAEAGAGADASPCDPTTPFSTITMVPGLPGGVEIHGRLSPDESTIWFDTTGGTLFVGTRQGLNATFSYKGLAADGGVVSFTGNDVFPTVSDDLKTLFFLNGDTNLITRATRSDSTQPFVSDGGALPLASPPGAQYRTPFVVGPTLYYGLFANGFPGSEIFFSDVTGSFTPPQAVSGFPLAQAGTGGPDGERFPVVSRDGNTIYFLDDGAGSTGEIYLAHRAQSSVPFTTASIVTELSSGAGEQPLWLSVDQCRLYFMSFRSPEGLYVASH